MSLRVSLILSFTLVAFAANSLLTRAALGAGRLDAATFTGIRLVTGAVTLAILARLRPRPVVEGGAWLSAAALAAYAVFFTVAYTRIGASVGALILFGSVQVTMIGTGLARGERPAAVDWLGLGLAVAGLLVLTLPGVTAPDVLGAASMIVAGACWGVYSINGRGSRDPLGATAGNFARAALGGLVFAVVASASRHITASGVWLASASGSIASGVGYTAWYAVLPALPSWRAAIVQLVVPILTGFGASLILSEPITARLVVAAVCIAAGVWLTVAPGWHRR